MLIETKLEQAIITAITEVTSDSQVRVLGSRQVSAAGNVKGKLEMDDNAIIVVKTGFRSNDAYSLTPISISGTVVITTSLAHDATGNINDYLCERVANLMQRWHDTPAASTAALSSTNFSFGEFRLDGGSGKTYDDTPAAWVESFNFTVRGAVIRQG
jgi:hypothetical protein